MIWVFDDDVALRQRRFLAVKLHFCRLRQDKNSYKLENGGLYIRNFYGTFIENYGRAF